MFEALIQKLEAAIDWDEQLDREIEEAVDGDGRRLGWGPYPYTSKIDAARGLLDRVLPGWSYRVARCAVSDDAWVIPDFNCPVHGERLRATLRQGIDWSDLTDVDLRPSGREATALCISILKALEIINAKSHHAPEAAPAKAGAEARPDSEATAQAEGGANRERAQQKIEVSVVDLTPLFDGPAENPMRFFSENVGNWGALQWFNRLVDACEDHDRKRRDAFLSNDADEKDMLSLSADTSKKIMSSSAFRLAREHKDDIRSALSAQVQDVAGSQLVPKEPTHAMIRAMSESRAKDDEGEFPCISELLGFSGENKTHSVLRSAYRAMLAAAPAGQDGT